MNDVGDNAFTEYLERSTVGGIAEFPRDVRPQIKPEDRKESHQSDECNHGNDDFSNFVPYIPGRSGTIS